MNQVTDTEAADATWRSLYRVGGTAPLIALVFYLSQLLVLIFSDPYPATVEGWIVLFQRSKVLGLVYLNALDIFSIAFLGTMFLALYVALRRDSESYMAIAALFAFIGIVVFIVPRVATLSLLPLSDQYAAATTDTQRAQILAAGEALHALGRATPQTMGFLFMAVASLLISAVMFQGDIFGRATACVGILASAVTCADHISLVIAPAVADILMPISGLLCLVWWLLISRRLFQLGHRS